jgi:hypothetical protein
MGKKHPHKHDGVSAEAGPQQPQVFSFQSVDETSIITLVHA